MSSSKIVSLCTLGWFVYWTVMSIFTTVYDTTAIVKHTPEYSGVPNKRAGMLIRAVQIWSNHHAYLHWCSNTLLSIILTIHMSLTIIFNAFWLEPKHTWSKNKKNLAFTPQYHHIVNGSIFQVCIIFQYIDYLVGT